MSDKLDRPKGIIPVEYAHFDMEDDFEDDEPPPPTDLHFLAIQLYQSYSSSCARVSYVLGTATQAEQVRVAKVGTLCAPAALQGLSSAITIRSMARWMRSEPHSHS